jgi:ParB family chromosome partitioning protein
MAKKSGLGRGLDSLFLEAHDSGEKSEPERTLRLTEIQPRSNQPRKHFDQEALSQLAQSIASNGLIQPIVVRSSIGGLYEIIAGERRWRACKMAGLTEVPVVILDTDDKKTAEISLIENIQREDLNPIEEAMAFRTLLSDYQMTQDEVANRVGKSRSAITNTLRLLDLPKETLDRLAAGSLTEGHGRALLGLADKGSIDGLAQRVEEEGLSVRQTEALVQRQNLRTAQEKQDEGEEKPASVKDVDYIAELEKKIRQTIGRRVKIVEGKRTKKLEVEYTDNDDLEKLLKSLCGDQIWDD